MHVQSHVPLDARSISGAEEGGGVGLSLSYWSYRQLGGLGCGGDKESHMICDNPPESRKMKKHSQHIFVL